MTYDENLKRAENQIASLQRELAEARNQQAKLTALLRPIMAARSGGSSKDLESAVDECALRISGILPASAPSDVKGEEPDGYAKSSPGDWDFGKANACIRGIGVAIGLGDLPDCSPLVVGICILQEIDKLKAQITNQRHRIEQLTDGQDAMRIKYDKLASDFEKAEASANKFALSCQHNAEIIGELSQALGVSPQLLVDTQRDCALKAIAALKSRASLTPLTDPSVRGVLVDDGEPRNLNHGDLFLNSAGEVQQWSSYTASQAKYQTVKVRPASDFGVSARGEPGLKRLPEGVELWGWVVRKPLKGERYREHNGLEYIANHDFSNNEWPTWTKLDPSLYAMPDGERVKELEAERSSFGSVLRQEREATHAANERVKELEVENKLLLHSNGSLAIQCGESERDAERLRKAIETHRDELRTARWGADSRLYAALTPSPAASGDAVV